MVYKKFTRKFSTMFTSRFRMYLVCLMITVSLISSITSALPVKGQECLFAGADYTCINVWKCRNFAVVLHRTPIPRPRHIIFQLKKYFCGLVNSTTPKICCHKDAVLASDAISEAVREPHQKTVQEGIEGRAGESLVTDLMRHKNFGLLPMDICGPIPHDVRITGGSNTNPGEFPWMALIVYMRDNGKPEFRCGGSLINDRYVLTAAHCIQIPSLLGVRLGEYNILTDIDCDQNQRCQPPPQDFLISNVTVHPQYNRTNFVNDIALIKLATPIDFSSEELRPICLPFGLQTDLDLIGKDLITAGWGVTDAEKGDRAAILQKVSITAIPNKICQRVYRDQSIIPTQLCAGGRNGKDTCAGDSGGPVKLIGALTKNEQKFVQHGIVSYGPKYCGIQGMPGVYTMVRPYIKWILDNLEHP